MNTKRKSRKRGLLYSAGNSNLPKNTSIKQNNDFDPVLEKLIGPVKLRYYKDLNGKRILLLGEHHDFIEPCMDFNSSNKKEKEVDEWIEYIAINSPVCIDLFSEDISL